MKRSSIRSWPIVRRVLIWRKAWFWTRYFLTRSGVFERADETNSARARLRKDAHALEKGLSLPDIQPFFGRAKIVKLIADIDAARSNLSLDPDREIAESVLSGWFCGIGGCRVGWSKLSFARLVVPRWVLPSWSCRVGFALLGFCRVGEVGPIDLLGDFSPG